MKKQKNRFVEYKIGELINVKEIRDSQTGALIRKKQFGIWFDEDDYGNGYIYLQQNQYLTWILKNSFDKVAEE